MFIITKQYKKEINRYVCNDESNLKSFSERLLGDLKTKYTEPDFSIIVTNFGDNIYISIWDEKLSNSLILGIEYFSIEYTISSHDYNDMIDF